MTCAPRAKPKKKSNSAFCSILTARRAVLPWPKVLRTCSARCWSAPSRWIAACTRAFRSARPAAAIAALFPARWGINPAVRWWPLRGLPVQGACRYPRRCGRRTPQHQNAVYRRRHPHQRQRAAAAPTDGHHAEQFDLPALEEFTVEAGRPDCTDEEKLRIIKEYGATRISINPQTFSDEVLRNIGRRHTAQDILDCYRTARRVGHDNINMDLIAGLPGDTVEASAIACRRPLTWTRKISPCIPSR